MNEIRDTCMTVGDLLKRLRHWPNSTPLYFGTTNKAPCLVESWNAEGELEGVDITPGLEHGE
mgnify:CR=1 FL=1